MTTAARIPSSSLAGPDSNVLEVWLGRHAVAMLAAIIVTVAIPSGVWVAIAAAASFAQLWYREHPRHVLIEPYGGWANRLTAVRLGLLLAALTLVHELASAVMLALFAANVAIDAVDGYVARRKRQATAFGAVFDREVDAVFVLAVYLYLFVASSLPVWVLIPGSLPYVFRLAVAARRDRPAPERRERLAVALAGANFVTLLAAVASPPRIQPYVVIASSALVGASFLISFLKLYHHDDPAS
jgi:phosphatidylglycerophosphate synthase